ncbi:MAG: hypothetical protein WC796_00495 [Candidatus Pacearchaeota archaeon]|jgi:hypothetical protein
MIRKISLNDKKAIEMSFVWIFAIVIGAMIVILALYLASQLTKQQTFQVNTVSAKGFVNMMDPLQTTVEQGKIEPVRMNTLTKVFVECEEDSDYGVSKVGLIQQTAFVKEQKPGAFVSIRNNYLFSEDEIEGKYFNFITVPFQMPFKAADMIIVYSGYYCFVNPPSGIKSDLRALGISNSSGLEIKDSKTQCSKDSKTVCFEQVSGCDANVFCDGESCEQGYVKKGTKSLYFINGLTSYGDAVNSMVYAAVFSSSDNYNCNQKRIFKRLQALSSLYAQKARFVSGRGCNTGLAGDLDVLGELAGNFKDAKDLSGIYEKAKEINQKNEVLQCQLF